MVVLGYAFVSCFFPWVEGLLHLVALVEGPPKSCSLQIHQQKKATVVAENV